jgi:large repetitive protein
MKNIRRSSGATRTRKNSRFSANSGSSILPLLGLAACGSDNASPSVTAPAITQVQAPTITQGQSATTSGNVLPTANQSGAAAATITAVSAQGGVSGIVGQALTTPLGTFTLNSNGSYSFVVADTNTVKALAANQTQDVIINFTAQNSAGSTTSTLKFTVTGINDAPVASNDSVTAPVIITAPVIGNVLGNDTDIDRGTTLTITNITVKAAQSGASQSASAQAALSATGVFGSISIESNGSYTYTVDKSDRDFLALRDGQTAIESFTYSVSDGQGGTATAELNITLTGVNEGPQAPQAVKVLDLREYGGSGATAEASVIVKIIGRDDAPVLKADVAAREVSAASPTFTVKLADLIVDPEGSATSITQIGYYSDFAAQTGTNYVGSYTINADTTVTFTLDTNSYGYRAATATNPFQDQIYFTASDGKVLAGRNLAINVTGVNDAPTANPVGHR